MWLSAAETEFRVLENQATTEQHKFEQFHNDLRNIRKVDYIIKCLSRK